VISALSICRISDAMPVAIAWARPSVASFARAV